MNAAALAIPTDVTDRTGYIGGSAIPALIGSDAFGVTPHDVFLTFRGEAPPREFTPKQLKAMRFGTLLEDVVAQEFALDNRLKVARVNVPLQHPKYPYLGGHIDRRIVGAPEGLEVKTTSYMNGIHNWSDDNPDNIPVHVTAQIQWYMELSQHSRFKFERFHVATLIGGQEPRQWIVERDPEMGAMMVEVAVKFVEQYVIPGIPPPPQSVDEVRRRFPQALSIPIAATPEVADAVELLAESTSDAKAAKKRIEAAQDVIASYMGECDTLTIHGKPALTFKTQANDGYTVSPFTTRVMRRLKGF